MKRNFLFALTLALFVAFATILCGCNSKPAIESSQTESQQEIPAKIVSFSDDVYTVNRFSTLTLNPNYQGNETLVWDSSDENIAIVKDGVVLAANVGIAEISVKVGDEEAKCTVAVRATTSYLSLQLSQTEIEVAKGKSKTIYASVADNFAQNIPSQFITYSYVSKDKNVVTVDENGVVTAVQLGETTITVSAVCAGEVIQEDVKITVKENVNISFDKTSVFLYSNSLLDTVVKTEQLNVFVYCDDQLVSQPTLSWEVENEAIATVSETGLVTGISLGETDVVVSYVTNNDTTFTAKITIKVSCPVVQTGKSLDLEVYADENTKVDLSEYAAYFSSPINEVEVNDDLGAAVSASITDGVATIENETLNYGERTLSFTLNSEVVFTYETNVVTKYISMASELAEFASKYGKRDATGTYSGWFVLTNNIDMTDVKINYSFGSDGVWSNNVAYGFKGIFDGRGYSIYNVSDNIFGKVSKEGVVKNTAFYSTKAVTFALVSGVFAGRLENVYVCADLSEVAQDYYSGVTFRTVGEPIFENVVVEITDKRDSVKSTIIHDAATGGVPTLKNVYLISPSKNDPTTETNNIQPTHYATDTPDKDFNNLDKSNGYWKNTNGVYRFASCEYFSLEKLETPDKASFAVDENGTLTWTAIENADGYTVLVNGVKQEVSTNSYEGVTNGMLIQVMAKGDAVAFRDSAYSETLIHLLVEGNYLADFSVEAYEEMIAAPTISEYIIPASLTAEYVENVTDKKGIAAENAVKVTSVTNNMGACFGDFVIKLPKKTMQNIVTVRFMIERLDDGLGFRSMTADFSGGALNGLENYEKGVWHTITYNYTPGTDFIGFRICNKAGLTGVIYFDCVMDGDCSDELQNELLKDVLETLETDLTKGYLADFSSTLYANLFVSDVNYGPASMTAEYIENVEDGNGMVATNALKITIKSPQVGSISQANFRLYLPIEMTNTTHQMRIMVKSEGLSEKWWVRTVKTDGGDLHLGTPNQQNFTTDTWCTVNIVNAYTDYIHFRVGADDVTSITYTIYFAWVK